MGVPVLTISGVEADDIIGTIARRSVEAGLHVTIVSPDKDFFQLLGQRVRQLRPNGKNYDAAKEAARDGEDAASDGFGDPTHRNVTGKGLVPFTERDFRAEFSDLDPAQFVDVLAMVGDASDNVPGAFVSHWSPYYRISSRGERRSSRTFSPGVSLRPGSLAFNPDTPRRLSTPLLTPMNS